MLTKRILFLKELYPLLLEAYKTHLELTPWPFLNIIDVQINKYFSYKGSSYITIQSSAQEFYPPRLYWQHNVVSETLPDILVRSLFDVKKV